VVRAENIALAKLIMVIKIKIVQTELDEEEYELLKAFVDSKGITMKEGLKELLLSVIKERRIKGDDPFFYIWTERCESDEEEVSEKHDRYIYK
jgi:beta-galactosidase beta subunit